MPRNEKRQKYPVPWFHVMLKGCSQKTDPPSINPAKSHLHHHFSPKAGTRHVSSPNFWRNARRVCETSRHPPQFSVFNIQCSVMLCGVWDNTHRGGVCDCDGVLGTRIKSQPPEANGLICLDQDQARGESD